MYDSIKAWINVPATILPYIKRLGNGDKLFGESYTQYTYPVSEVTTVRNKDGVDVSSSQQLYVDGSSGVGVFDEVIFEGMQWEIQAIRTFYRNGVPDLKVVYL